MHETGERNENQEEVEIRGRIVREISEEVKKITLKSPITVSNTSAHRQFIPPSMRTYNHPPVWTDEQFSMDELPAEQEPKEVIEKDGKQVLDNPSFTFTFSDYFASTDEGYKLKSDVSERRLLNLFEYFFQELRNSAASFYAKEKISNHPSATEDRKEQSRIAMGIIADSIRRQLAESNKLLEISQESVNALQKKIAGYLQQAQQLDSSSEDFDQQCRDIISQIREFHPRFMSSFGVEDLAEDPRKLLLDEISATFEHINAMRDYFSLQSQEFRSPIDTLVQAKKLGIDTY